MEAILDSIRQFASTADEVALKELSNKLQGIVYTFEDVSDTTDRFGHAVSPAFREGQNECPRYDLR